MMNLEFAKNFTFSPKNVLLDWKKIASVDLDNVIKNNDLVPLENNLTNVAFFNIPNEFKAECNDPTLFKIMSMAQLIIDYLLFSQNILLEKEKQIKNEILEDKKLKEEKENEFKIINEILLKSKKECHNRKKIIISQQKLIKIGVDSYHKCFYCDKVFMSATFLQNHFLKKHKEEMMANNEVNRGLVEKYQKEDQEKEERLKQTENVYRNLSEKKEEEIEKLKDEIIKLKNDKHFEVVNLNQFHQEELEEINTKYTKQLEELQGKLDRTQSSLTLLQNKFDNITSEKVTFEERERKMLKEFDEIKKQKDAQLIEEMKLGIQSTREQWESSMNKSEKFYQNEIFFKDQKYKELLIAYENLLNKNESNKNENEDLSKSNKTLFSVTEESKEDISTVDNQETTSEKNQKGTIKSLQSEETDDSLEKKNKKFCEQQIEKKKFKEKRIDLQNLKIFENEKNKKNSNEIDNNKEEIKIYKNKEMINKEFYKNSTDLNEAKKKIKEELELRFELFGIKPDERKVEEKTFIKALSMLRQERILLQKDLKDFSSIRSHYVRFCEKELKSQRKRSYESEKFIKSECFQNYSNKNKNVEEYEEKQLSQESSDWNTDNDEELF